MQEWYTLNRKEFELSLLIAKIENILALSDAVETIIKDTAKVTNPIIAVNIFLNLDSKSLYMIVIRTDIWKKNPI